MQGQRTVGITEKPELVPLDKLEQQFGFVAPRDKGMDTAEACEAVLAGKLQAFIALGGNFIRAIPDTAVMEAAWRRIPLTVQIATKLNRSHVIHGADCLHPAVPRTHRDRPTSLGSAGGDDGRFNHVLPRLQRVRGAGEPTFVVGAEDRGRDRKAALTPNPKVPWDEWVRDYAKIRRAMEETWSDVFKDFNARMWTPGGVERPLAARHRKWETGRANFLIPLPLDDDPRARVQAGGDVLRLTTLRSNDQFNTTVYGYSDRYRGVEGARKVVFMNVADMARLGLKKGETINLTTALADNVRREVQEFRIVPYPIAAGCIAAYFLEATPLIPLWHRDANSHTPGYKALPVRVTRTAAGV